MEKGDILGHEFCGVIESMGSAVTNHKVGDRVVASFQIACGDVSQFHECVCDAYVNKNTVLLL